MKKRKASDRAFDIFVYTILIFLSVSIVLPFMQIITISVSPSEVLNTYGMHIFPTKITWEGYATVFENELLWNSYYLTIVRTVVGTTLNVILTVCAAYPLSKKHFPNRRLWTGLVIFTMYFSGGLVPTYMLVRNLGMINSMSALIFPGLVSAFNLIITRNFFMSIPESLEESAKLDGANDIKILTSIILPLSKPIIATISLWYAVGHWNAWFDSMIYINDENKQILQMILRKIVLQGSMAQDAEAMLGGMVVVSTQTVKMATLIVSIVPIMLVYPFIQKYFVKGVLIGSVKG